MDICTKKNKTLCISRHIHGSQSREGGRVSFRGVVEETCAQLEGAFALVFKSVLYPGEVVATRRGSPLLVGGC